MQNKKRLRRKLRLNVKCIYIVNLNPNLFSPFPFWSANYSSADAFHHKSRRASTGTRTCFHYILPKTRSLSIENFINPKTFHTHPLKKHSHIELTQTTQTNVKCSNYKTSTRLVSNAKSKGRPFMIITKI